MINKEPLEEFIKQVIDIVKSCPDEKKPLDNLRFPPTEENFADCGYNVHANKVKDWKQQVINNLTK